MFKIDIAQPENTGKVDYTKGRIINAIPDGFGILTMGNGSIYVNEKNGRPCLTFSFIETNKDGSFRTYPNGGNVKFSIIVGLTDGNISKVFHLFNGAWKAATKGQKGFGLSTSFKDNTQTGIPSRVNTPGTPENMVSEFIKNVTAANCQELADEFNRQLIDTTGKTTIEEVFESGNMLIHWDYNGKKFIPYSDGGDVHNPTSKKNFGVPLIFPFSNDPISFEVLIDEDELGNKTEKWKLNFKDTFYEIKKENLRIDKPAQFEAPVEDLVVEMPLDAPLDEM